MQTHNIKIMKYRAFELSLYSYVYSGTVELIRIMFMLQIFAKRTKNVQLVKFAWVAHVVSAIANHLTVLIIAYYL